ncbi:MAG: cupin domain-containing protein [Balneolaceae bacterium]|nr:cupin domain-containing protein [Balneolaceae bacterium]MBO6547456.1 cupin domain-containing protein [Balneolaceae bacterium]MBO6647597.1 cupin domain-containing protein [Balneolaceae bacterium]
MSVINLKKKLELFNELWTPKIISETNGQLVKLAKLKGEFVWHNHANEDELFYIVKGELLLKFKDREVQLREGDLYVVPKGEDHLPIAEEECWVMLIEPKGTKHTGEVYFEGTVEEKKQDWI